MKIQFQTADDNRQLQGVGMGKEAWMVEGMDVVVDELTITVGDGRKLLDHAAHFELVVVRFGLGSGYLGSNKLYKTSITIL